MKYHLLRIKESWYSSIWVIPLICSVFGIGLSVFLTHPKLNIYNHWIIDNIFYIGIDSANSILSTIAGSVITITSVVFSITILTLTLAISQLGPRLLPNFMRRGHTQWVLGIFIGTFIYCLFTLRAIGGEDLPAIAILTGLLLGLLSFFTLVYFIHTVVQMIQIDNVLDDLSNEIKKSIKREFIKIENGEDNNGDELEQLDFKQIAESHEATPITGSKSGYIVSIDYQKLLVISVKHNCILDLHFRAGHFLNHDATLMTLYCQDEIPSKAKDELRRQVAIGARRTLIQDVEFGYEQIVEIAVRAMSPGINEPFTAVHCLNILSDCLIYLNHYQIPKNILIDHNHKERLHFDQITYHSIIETCFNRFRQQAVDDLTVGIRLLEVIENILSFDINPDLRSAIITQAHLLYTRVIDKDISQKDKEDLQARFECIMNG